MTQATPDAGGGVPSSGSSQDPVLEASGVRKRYGAVTALADVSLSVFPGECVALVGESGSGKTTLLRTFNRLVEPDEGRVRVRGRSVADVDAVRLRRRLGYVPQEGGLLPHWSVARNVELVPELQGLSDAPQRGRRALARVGLDPEVFAGRWPRELSGGQRQRVALARALAADPDVVLLDEPFGALDALSRADAQALLKRLLDAGDVTALLVTHDLREAFLLADRVGVLRDGRIEQVDAPAALREAPATPYVAALLQRGGVA
jgi:osmoprotectant transport system ATP-binding protein